MRLLKTCDKIKINLCGQGALSIFLLKKENGEGIFSGYFAQSATYTIFHFLEVSDG